MIKYLPDNFTGSEEAVWSVWGEFIDIAMDIPMRYFGNVGLGEGAEIKADSSPVTVADRETEQALRQVIMGAFPEHVIIGEEYGGRGKGAGYEWFIDPIDGTKSFMCGMPLFGCMVGLLRDGKPIVGMVVMPALGQVFFGVNDLVSGAWCNGEVIRVDDSITRVSGMRLSIGEGDKFYLAYPGGFGILLASVSMVRLYHDCYSFCLLSGGGLHGVVEVGLQLYDIVPIIPIICGAGGCVSDWGGGEIGLADWDGRVIAVANGNLHEEILGIIKKSF